MIVPASFNFPHTGKLLSLSFVLFAAGFPDATAAARRRIRNWRWRAWSASSAASPRPSRSCSISSGFPPTRFNCFSPPASSTRASAHWWRPCTRSPSRCWATCAVTGHLRWHRAAVAGIRRPHAGAGHRPDRRHAPALCDHALAAVFEGHRAGRRCSYVARRSRRPWLGAPSPAPPTSLPPLETIQARSVLRVGYLPDALPFAFVNQRGELVGFDIELAHDLARELGVSLAFVPVDPRRDGGAARRRLLRSRDVGHHAHHRSGPRRAVLGFVPGRNPRVRRAAIISAIGSLIGTQIRKQGPLTIAVPMSRTTCASCTSCCPGDDSRCATTSRRCSRGRRGGCAGAAGRARLGVDAAVSRLLRGGARSGSDPRAAGLPDRQARRTAGARRQYLDRLEAQGRHARLRRTSTGFSDTTQRPLGHGGRSCATSFIGWSDMTELTTSRSRRFVDRSSAARSFGRLSSSVRVTIGARSHRAWSRQHNEDHYLVVRLGRHQETLATSLSRQRRAAAVRRIRLRDARRRRPRRRRRRFGGEPGRAQHHRAPRAALRQVERAHRSRRPPTRSSSAPNGSTRRWTPRCTPERRRARR